MSAGYLAVSHPDWCEHIQASARGDARFAGAIHGVSGTCPPVLGFSSYGSRVRLTYWTADA
jgi:hypothetical protein